MNKWLKRALNFTLFCIAFNTLEHFCHKKTAGFSLLRLQFDDEKPEVIFPDPATLSHLNQPYRYLGHGNQSYVFVSEDGEYILKFFKYARPPIPAWASRIPLLNKFKPFSLKRINKAAAKKKRDFEAYQLAYKELREETGLLYLHLNPSENTYPNIPIRDQFNNAYILDLNTTPFVLQKRAVPAFRQFSRWIKNGEIEKAQQGIHNLFDLFSRRISKHIEDDDSNFYSNCGFIGETPILIDPGHFIINPSLSPHAELHELSVELQKWFAKHYPPLASHVQPL